MIFLPHTLLNDRNPLAKNDISVRRRVLHRYDILNLFCVIFEWTV